MICNVFLRLAGGHIRRGWIDDNVVDRTKLRRLLCTLKHLTTLQEQEELLEKYIPSNKYNEKAEQTVVYNNNSNRVRICEASYNEVTKLFARGKYIDEFNI